jgi:hypothetical protein
MRTLIVALGSLLVLAASSAYAADSGSRTYADPSCTDRNANSENCLIQDGPARRGTAGGQTPTAKSPSSAPGAAAGASAGSGISGSGSGASGGSGK